MTGQTLDPGLDLVLASPAQRRLWFVHRLNPGDPAYHVPTAVRLLGPLDVPALERALAGVVERQEALRTVFREVDGEPRQLLLPMPGPAAFRLPVTAVVADEAELAAAISASSAAPFDLTTGPMLHADLIRTTGMVGDGHVLVLTAHHIAVDGWSLGVLFTELSELYRAEVDGGPAGLPELPVRFAELARSEPAADLDQQLAWWRSELAGAPMVLDLPTEFPRTGRASGAGAVARLRFDPELSDDVRELALATGGTLYMTMLAAFQLLLGRYAGTEQLVVGSPVAGRQRPELEPLVGCFINTLPIRGDLSGDPSFRELVARVRDTALGAFAHQEVSFEAIVEAVRPDRSLAETPIFQVLFSVDESTEPVTQAGGLLWQFLPPLRERVKYDLNLTVGRAGDDLEVTVEYRADRFGPTWVAGFLDHFRTLVGAAALDPDQQASRLPLLAPAARRRVLEAWNGTAVEYPDVPVTELVHRQVAATPGAVAVVCGQQRLTYAELAARSARLAHRLQALGCGPGNRVGLCLERSAELVVAVLGVLASGAAYVPLDPEYPAERLEFMVADAEARVVLTHGAAADAVAAGASTVLDLDDVDLGPGAGLPDGPPAGGPTPADPAYVIYTSGSTGRPKGVVNTHRGLVNRLLWMQDTFRLDGSDAVLQKTPYSFDVSVWEFLWPLISGARLVLARPGGHRDPAYLAAEIEGHRVTTVHFVPSMLQVFTDTTALPACLRRVICSGEALSADLARRVVGDGGGPELHNLYGPTEAAIDVSHWHCTPTDGAGPVPIGHPVANTQLHVVDGRLEPVPVGVAGELVIGGVQVAAGYVNRPELTAERFVPDPFRPGGRLYRTGDLARRRADGAIEFLGRLDHQIKLRGFRIELGEVEAGLREVEGVCDAVAGAVGDQLAGWLVTRPGAPGDDDVRADLARRLPAYLVPAYLVRLDALPLTPNGKVERAALPAPDRGRPRAVRVPPRDGLELDLVAMWEDLLGVRQIGVTDDFFELGGSSLQVIRLLGRIGERHGVELSVSTMFAGGATVERLARQVREGRSVVGWAPVVPLRATGTRPPVFCLPPAVGNVLCFVDLVRRLPADVPVYGLQASGLDPGQIPIPELAEATAHYVRAIREVQPTGPYRLVGYCVGSVAAHAVARRLVAEGEEVSLLAVLDGGPPALDNGFEDADEADIAAWFGWELGRAVDRRLVIDAAELRGLTGEGLAAEVVRRALAADVLPPDAGQTQITRLLATFDAGVRASRNHRLEPFPGPMLALRAAEEDPESSSVRRWAALCTRLDEVEVPGDHYSIMRPPHVDAVAALLDQALTKTETDTDRDQGMMR